MKFGPKSKERRREERERGELYQYQKAMYAEVVEEVVLTSLIATGIDNRADMERNKVLIIPE